jgi:hypothetical protein
MAELGNLVARILLPLRRMSTVKIRAGSLFHTGPGRIGPSQAASGAGPQGFFLRRPQSTCFLHKMYTGREFFRLA